MSNDSLSNIGKLWGNP